MGLKCLICPTEFQETITHDSGSFDCPCGAVNECRLVTTPDGLEHLTICRATKDGLVKTLYPCDNQECIAHGVNCTPDVPDIPESSTGEPVDLSSNTHYMECPECNHVRVFDVREV